MVNDTPVKKYGFTVKQATAGFKKLAEVARQSSVTVKQAIDNINKYYKEMEERK